MKKFLRFLLIFILLIALTGGGYYVYIHYIKESPERDTMSVIPEDAIFVVETNNLAKAWRRLESSLIWGHLLANPYFSGIDSTFSEIEEYLSMPVLKQMFDGGLENRKLMMSAHMISGVDFDFIFVVDLKKAPNFTAFSKAIEMADYTVKERSYKGEKIIELHNNMGDDVIYLTVIDNLLVVSFTGVLLEDAILSKDGQQWKNSALFQRVATDIRSTKLVNFYFNYSQLDRFSRTFMDEAAPSIKTLAAAMAYSAFNLDLDDTQINLDGYTNLDSVPSYLSALAGVKPGALRSHEILSDQTSFLMSLGFDNFNEFYANLMQQYTDENTEDFEDIDKNVKRIEKLLNINLQENLFDWIGSEVAFAKMRPGKKFRVEDVVVAIHANDIGKAEAGFGHIIDQLRKRSPMRFDEVVHKNFKINYLNISGFFKIFLGNMFDKLEKPYFTYIEDYMVLSNSQDVLKEVINDYVEGRILSRNEEFMNFRNEFSIKSNVSVFVRMPKVYSNMYYYGSHESRESLKENKELILSFARIGFQLETDGEKFRNYLLAEHDPNAMLNDQLEIIEEESSEDLFTVELDSLNFKVSIPDSIEVENSSYTLYYDIERTKVHFEGTIVDGQLQGLGRSRFVSGNLKNTLNYNAGMLDGTATFYYDDDQQTRRAEVTFDADKITDVYREFYPNGARKAELSYKDGEKHGDAKFFHETGALKIEGEYKDGQKHGRWKFYDENGDLISKEKWRKGDRKDA